MKKFRDLLLDGVRNAIFLVVFVYIFDVRLENVTPQSIALFFIVWVVTHFLSGFVSAAMDDLFKQK